MPLCPQAGILFEYDNMTKGPTRPLITLYSEYYSQDETLSEWRRLGAIDKTQNIVELCNDLPHDKIVEVGCGDGAVLKRLAETGFGARWTGLEISPSGVQRAREKQIANATFECFDGEIVPFENQVFDLAILTHVLEHVEYPRQLIYEAARIAKYIFIEVPLEDNARLPLNFVFDQLGHINFYNPRTIRQLIQSCGPELLSTKLTQSSRCLYLHRKGLLRGHATYFIKGMALSIAPSLATQLLTYHLALISKSH